MPVIDGVIIMGATALMSLGAALGLSPLASHLGWLDHPDARKAHAKPTPLVGGVAIFLACLVTTIILDLAVSMDLALAAGLMLVSGLVDDRWPLSALTRFAMQIVACLIMIYGAGILLDDFGRLFWDTELSLGPLAVPVTIFAALGVINAFNMMDGLDGLSGNVFLVSAMSVALLAGLAAQIDAVTILIMVMGGVLGFLVLNARMPWNSGARVFLGDSGSQMLGLFLAWMFIDLGNGADRAFAPMTAVWIFAIPLLDTTRMIRRRWREGGSAFEADHYHLHHAFLRAGFSASQTCWLITLACLACATVGVAAELVAIPEYVRFYGFVAFGVAYLYVMRRTWREKSFLGRPIHDLRAS